MKITFMGAGSSIFVKNVLGDSMMCDVLKDAEFALYDIDGVRLEESRQIIEYLNASIAGGKAKVTTFLGADQRKDALRGVLAQDPRPSYQDDPDRIYGMPYGGYDIRFTVRGEELTVVAVALLSS